MAETVTMKFQLQGADQAARDMEKLGDRTRTTGRAADEAQRKFDAMLKAAQGRSGTAGFTPIPGGQGAGLRTWGGPAYAAPPGSVPPLGAPWGPPPSSLTAQMQQYQQQMAAFGPAPPGVGPGGKGGGLGSRYQSQLLSVIGLTAGAQGIEGVGRAFQEIAGQSTTLGGAMQSLAREFVDTIPIVGHVARGLEHIADALTGVASARAFGAEFTGAAGRQSAFAGGAAAARFRGGQELIGLALGAGDAAISQRAAEAQLAGLTPGVLAGFREPGGVGSAKQAAYAAQFGEQAARERVGLRLDEAQAAAFQSELAGRAVRAAQPDADARKADVERLQLERDQSYGFGRPGGGRLRSDIDIDLIGAKSNEAAARGRLDNALADQKRALNAEQQRGVDLAKEEAGLAQETLRRRQAQLEVRRADNDQARRAAEFSGAAAPGEQELRLQIARQIKSGGIGSVPPQLADLAAQDPTLREFVRTQREAAGAADPNRQIIDREFGRPAANDFDKITDDLNRQAAENQREFANRIKGSNLLKFDTLGDTIIEAINSEVAALENRLRQEFLKAK